MKQQTLSEARPKWEGFLLGVGQSAFDGLRRSPHWLGPRSVEPCRMRIKSIEPEKNWLERLKTPRTLAQDPAHTVSVLFRVNERQVLLANEFI